MSELPIDLIQLQPVRGALDILRYLYKQNDYAADGDDIMDDLGLSSRGWDKAKRRLVTRSYIQMRSDYIYELTSKGVESAETLKAYDAGGGADDEDDKFHRQLVLALPRNLVLGTTSPMKVGIEANSDMDEDASLVIRMSAINADLGEWNEMVTLGSDALIMDTSIKPHPFHQIRLKLEVYQFSPSGDDLRQCGGMYCDVAVLETGEPGEIIGYAVDLEFD